MLVGCIGVEFDLGLRNECRLN